RTADETELERGGDQRAALQSAAHRDQRILLAAGLLRGHDAVTVLLGVAELQWVGGLHAGPQFLRGTLVEQREQPGAGADGVMVAALRADHQVALQLRLVQHRTAARALLPNALGHLALAGGSTLRVRAR